MPGGRFGIIILALIALGIYYMSNQEVNPYSGKREFNTISIEQASQLGAQSYVQMLQQEGRNVICGGGINVDGNKVGRFRFVGHLPGGQAGVILILIDNGIQA